MPYVHRKIDNTLSLLKKTVIHKSNPTTRTRCVYKAYSTSGSVKLTVTSPLGFWNRDARQENQGSVVVGAERERSSNLADKSLYLPLNHEYGFLQ
jgi:hypothetical protein